MDPNPDVLREILRKLDAMDNTMRGMDERLRSLEAGKGDIANAEPAGAFYEAETVLDAPEVFHEAQTLIDPPSAFHEVETLTDLPQEASSGSAPGVPVPPPLHSAVTSAPTQGTSQLPGMPVPPPPMSDKVRTAANSIAGDSPALPVPPLKTYHEAVAQLDPAVVNRKPKQSLEVRIATTWLQWIALFCLALVCVYLAKTFSQGPLGKVAGCYIVSIGMIIVGFLKEKKYPRWASPVLAGGLAFTYFTSYAMGFVEPMRLLDNLGVKLALLAANLAFIFGIAHWKKSEVIGGTALVLGYLTTGVVGNERASFCSAVALSAIALLFLWFNRWFVATALAALATYVAHFYVWKAVPDVVERTATENFWYHSMFLSLYFMVYTAAALVGKRDALTELSEDEDRYVSSSRLYSRFHMLLLLTQTNVAAYVAGMIAVLKLTEVYWDKAWMFFFPMAAVCGLLGMLFVGLSALQRVYLVAGTLCLSFGIIALASPMWLPVLLSLQALAMLWRAKGDLHALWSWLGVGVLCYAILYLLTEGAIDVLQFSSLNGERFPLWTRISVAAVTLAFAMRWEKNPVENGAIFKYMIAMMAAIVCLPFQAAFPEKDALLVHSAALVTAAIAMRVFRVTGPVVFVVAMAVFSITNLGAMPGDDRQYHTVNWALAVLAIAGMGVGLHTEKCADRTRQSSRLLWRCLYIWAPLVLAISLLKPMPKDYTYQWIGLTLEFAGLIGLAWVFRSAALGKSAYVLLVAYVGLYGSIKVDALKVLVAEASATNDIVILFCSLAMMAAVFPVALPRWEYRTGDSKPLINEIGQTITVALAGIFVVWGTGLFKGTNHVFLMGCFAVIYALYAALGRFRGPAVLVLVAAIAALLQLVYDFGEGYLAGRSSQDIVLARYVGWSVAGVLLFVGAERLIAGGRRISMAGANPEENWFSPQAREFITSGLAIGTLIMLVLALRTLPDLRLFYFTGVMVAAAFLWIVFGFLFREPVYRKSGFILLCVGILKGLIWDVLSLKDAMHRIVSWTILGLLALAASFIYTRYRGRLEESADGLDGLDGQGSDGELVFGDEDTDRPR